MDTEEQTTCFHHTDREAGRKCTRCGRTACGDCLIQAPVGAHCFECVRAARPPARERLRRWNAGAGPLVTQSIVAVNVAVYLLTATNAKLQDRLVLFGPAVHDGGLYRLVTSGFVHFGIMHIGFNMVLLYRFGDTLERALGRTRYALLFTASLLGGSLGALLLTPHAPTGGASGAVFGLMGAVAIGLRQRGVSLAEGGVGALIAINLVLSVVLPGISLGAHVGGLLAGGAAGAMMLRTGDSRRLRLESAAFAVALVVVAVAGSIAVSGR
ncbi:MAG TPA: rhomboid family intramembrane serine protease [Acidimicrobiales bacterium]|nr:rhomboid family intramembrane serine protease [Acidimicrobiales bacterium]